MQLRGNYHIHASRFFVVSQDFSTPISIFSPVLYIPQVLIAEEVRNREGAKLLAMDERKRPYNSLRRDGDNKAPTEEEMEAFRLKRQRQEDPMAAFL